MFVKSRILWSVTIITNFLPFSWPFRSKPTIALLSHAGRSKRDQSHTSSTVSGTSTSASAVQQVAAPTEQTAAATALAYESMPSTPSTVNPNETSVVFSREGAHDMPRSQEATPTSSRTTIMPPQNFDMTPVSTYQGLSAIFWTSPTFTSCQLGYKLNLVVRFNPENPLALDMTMRSTQDRQNDHMKYPCTGVATMMILNPHSNSDHVKCDMNFVLHYPSTDPPNFSEGSSFRFPENFIDDDRLYLQVSGIQMDGSNRPWLLNPYLANIPEQ